MKWERTMQSGRATIPFTTAKRTMRKAGHDCEEDVPLASSLEIVERRR